MYPACSYQTGGNSSCWPKPHKFPACSERAGDKGPRWTEEKEKNLSSLMAKTCVRKGKTNFKEQGGWLENTKLHFMYTKKKTKTKNNSFAQKYIHLFIHQLLVGGLRSDRKHASIHQLHEHKQKLSKINGRCGGERGFIPKREANLSYISFNKISRSAEKETIIQSRPVKPEFRVEKCMVTGQSHREKK